ncbi:hypothetical protein QBC35DRAFT_510683 [Podospora australis]|uniref:C2H2-type domain-containing protein n=1 Tax=Podospora australis TaxID=1536484 RepID=A0AAN6WHA1_9PEZI|nr:hypothetical protein QBC35DRAFT_510683 [Podospora australis]
MFECGTCGKVFPAGWQARENHCNSTGHEPPEFECFVCDEYFDDNWDCSEHMRDSNHLPNEYSECTFRECIEVFWDDEDAVDHEVHDHWYCGDCKRDFQDLNSIKQHRNSRAHRGQDIKCPSCKQGYTTATGLTHHLERGACPKASHLNRDQIYNFVRIKDPNGLISKKLLAWAGSDITHEATERAWNGRSWECYICHRGFNTLKSLNQHLASPTHQQTLYHCPNRNCGSDFKSLAAIINHLESESCGAMRFEQVQTKITSIVSSNRLLTL